MNKILDIRNLNVDYKVKDGYLSAVEDVNFSVDEGEIYALVGESGCGKSTIAYTIMRLLMAGNEKITGEVNFKESNLLELDRDTMESIRGKEIGMIFQNPLDSLNPVYTSGYQIAEAIMLDNIPKEDAYKRVVALFDDVKIPDSGERVKSFPYELSGGMRQRAMIAMMLSRKPSLLIADEPTTALDVTIQAQILEILKRLKREYKTSILIITHDFGVVAELADRIGVMYAGKLIEEGNVYQIFNNPSHPYTRSLLKSLPRIKKDEGRLEVIEGAVPKLIGTINGCRFANRCKYKIDACDNSIPPIKTVEDGHTYMCHLEKQVLHD